MLITYWRSIQYYGNGPYSVEAKRPLSGAGQHVSPLCLHSVGQRGTELGPLCPSTWFYRFSSLFGLGFGLGGPLGGYINDNFGWRWAFILQVRLAPRVLHFGLDRIPPSQWGLTSSLWPSQVPLLILAIVLVAIFVDIKLPSQSRSTKEKLQRIDYFGSLTLASTVGSLLLAVTLRASEELPWSHPWVYGLLITSAIMSVAFIYVEGWFAKEPILPLRLLKQRTPRFVALSNL